MGMFDAPTGKPFADNYSPGEAFVLQAARLVENVTTEFGTGTMIVLTIDGEDYTIFGKGIENQIRQQDEGDLPARVKLAKMPAKKGRSGMKLLVPANTPTDSTHTVIIDSDTGAPAGPTTGDGIPF